MLKFLSGLDADIKKALIAQLGNLWTHGSTAIEGNSLTLGETAFVLAEGLTVSGKSLKDHQEVVGHARAIDLIYYMVQRGSGITESDLFLLHKAVQTASILEVYKPVGNWKKEPNGTYIVDGEKQLFYEFATPADVPSLMTEWMVLLNSMISTGQGRGAAVTAYADLHMAFVWIHPFFDGNGRMARLVANLPVLKAGFPPIMIPKEKRREYIQCLSRYSLKAGPPDSRSTLLPVNDALIAFRTFCEESWRESMDLVAEAHKKQKERNCK
ncbi:MAG: Fic family protein [Pseudomonadota bacterium]